MTNRPDQPTATDPPLCDRCLIEPWGEQIWRDFHDQKRTFTGESLQQVFYERAKGEPLLDPTNSCTWCRFVGEHLRLPDSNYTLRQCLSSMPDASATFRIKFPDISHSKPERFTTAKLSAIVRWGDEMNDFYATFGVMAQPGGPASATFIAPDVFDGVEPAKGSFNVDLAKRWLEDCAENHAACRREFRPKLPGRVLDLSRDGPLVSLREVEDGATGQYACLSYTWGGAPDLPEIFTRAARAMFAAPVAVETLPWTFQDAIIVARSLDLRYLWIDGLCIWQDEPEDKAKHIPRMHEYFGNATIMIQAPGTKSVDDAFLGPSRVPEVARRLLPWDKMMPSKTPATETSVGPVSHELQGKQPGTDISFYSFPCFSHDGQEDQLLLYPFQDGLEPYSAKTEPASQRGWILQEELLCRRVLVFPSTGGMVFRCRADSAETHDGNTIFHSDHHFEPFPDKKVMLKKEEQEMGLDLFSAHRRITLDRARRLARAGNNPWMSWYDGGMVLHLGKDPEHTIHALEEGYSAAPVWIDNPNGSRTVCPYSARLYSKKLADDPAADPDFSKIVYSSLPPDRITGSSAMTAWRSMVNDYSRRKLTRPSDKLPAIAALAREFQSRYAPIVGGYAAGLWSYHAENLLAWYVPRSTDGKPPPPRPTPSRAPSWSWVGVEGARYDPQDEATEEEDAVAFKTTEVEMTEFRIQAVDAAGLYEFVVGGVMQLKCPAMRVVMTGTDDPISPSIVEFDSKQELEGCWPYLDCAEAVFAKGDQLGVYFVLLHRSTTGVGNPRDKWEGILVMKMPDDSRNPGSYARLAYLKWWGEREKMNSVWMERLFPMEISII